MLGLKGLGLSSGTSGLDLSSGTSGPGLKGLGLSSGTSGGSSADKELPPSAGSGGGTPTNLPQHSAGGGGTPPTLPQHSGSTNTECGLAPPSGHLNRSSSLDCSSWLPVSGGGGDCCSSKPPPRIMEVDSLFASMPGGRRLSRQHSLPSSRPELVVPMMAGEEPLSIVRACPSACTHACMCPRSMHLLNGGPGAGASITPLLLH